MVIQSRTRAVIRQIIHLVDTQTFPQVRLHLATFHRNVLCLDWVALHQSVVILFRRGLFKDRWWPAPDAVVAGFRALTVDGAVVRKLDNVGFCDYDFINGNLGLNFKRALFSADPLKDGGFEIFHFDGVVRKHLFLAWKWRFLGIFISRLFFDRNDPSCVVWPRIYAFHWGNASDFDVHLQHASFRLNLIYLTTIRRFNCLLLAHARYSLSWYPVDWFTRRWWKWLCWLFIL